MNRLRVAALAAGAALLLPGCGELGPVTVEPAAAGPSAGPDAGPRWVKVAAAPLRPWLQAVTVWTGREIVVLTGDAACPAGRQCPPADPRAERGAAAYDPAADKWRTLAAPTFSLYHASVAAIGRRIFVLAPANNPQRLPEFYAYSLDDGDWRRLPDPPIGPNVGTPSAITGVGGQLLAWDRFPTRHDPTDLRYDPAADEWSIVPPDPWGPGQERAILGLPDGRAVSVAAPLPGPPDTEGARPPRYWRAAVLDLSAGAWRTLPPSGIAVSPISSPGHGGWVVAGGLVVNPESGTLAAPQDGARQGSPRTIPAGGVLDPTAGTWATLPEPPANPAAGRGGGPLAWATIAGGDVAILRGRAYDVVARSWAGLPPVPGAPDGLTEPALARVDGRLYVWDGAVDDSGPSPDGGLVAETAPGWVLR